MTVNDLGEDTELGEGARNRNTRETSRQSAKRRRDEGGRLRLQTARGANARTMIAAAPAARRNHSGRTNQWMSKP
jgi:hypothetical protein